MVRKYSDFGPISDSLPPWLPPSPTAWSRTPAWPSSRGNTGHHTPPDGPDLEQIIIGQSGGRRRDHWPVLLLHRAISWPCWRLREGTPLITLFPRPVSIPVLLHLKQTFLTPNDSLTRQNNDSVINMTNKLSVISHFARRVNSVLEIYFLGNLSVVLVTLFIFISQNPIQRKTLLRMILVGVLFWESCR